MLTLYPSLHIKEGASTYMPHSRSSHQSDEFLRLNPVERALSFQNDGFSWIHIVDLDAAFSEAAINRSCIEEIIRSLCIPVQISGGIHDMKSIEGWIDRGAACVVLTSAAVKNPGLVREAAKKFPGKIAVKIESIGGYVTRTGWMNTSELKALDLALQVEDAGVAKIIYADINQDGALSEVDLETTTDLAFTLSIPVIAAGGVYLLQDLDELMSHRKAGIEGLILGRTLFNGILDPKLALKIARGK